MLTLQAKSSAQRPSISAKPHAVVIGSGFGGLAAAVRLGARGYRVNLHGLTLNISTLIDTQTREQHYGLEHIALDTDDYPGTLARLRANGVRILEELPPANGRRVCFLEAPDGVQIEVIEKV
jgi:catechol 2,3-dioxygenase-like lactoylglutathione lyase family enzyme